jgi:hypothetical protein
MPGTAAKPHQSPPRNSLSAELHRLNEKFGVEDVELGELIELMGDRAYSMMLVLLALPFFTPIGLVGISTAAGAVIAYLGLRLSLGLKPHLPDFLRKRRLPPRFFGLLMRGAERIIRQLERLSRRRLVRFVENRVLRTASGLGIVIAACLLMLPLPIPLTNSVPALTITLFALARMEEDGLMLLVGFGSLVVSIVFFGFLAFFGAETFAWLKTLYGMAGEAPGPTTAP